MKYAVMASLSFDTSAKNDLMIQAIKDKIAGKLTWGAIKHYQGISEEGKPSNFLEIRFENEMDMDALYDLIMDRMIRIPVLKGSLSKHYCLHDEGNIPCEPPEMFIKR